MVSGIEVFGIVLVIVGVWILWACLDYQTEREHKADCFDRYESFRKAQEAYDKECIRADKVLKFDLES